MVANMADATSMIASSVHITLVATHSTVALTNKASNTTFTGGRLRASAERSKSCFIHGLRIYIGFQALHTMSMMLCTTLVFPVPAFLITRIIMTIRE